MVGRADRKGHHHTDSVHKLQTDREKGLRDLTANQLSSQGQGQNNIIKKITRKLLLRRVVSRQEQLLNWKGKTSKETHWKRIEQVRKLSQIKQTQGDFIKEKKIEHLKLRKPLEIDQIKLPYQAWTIISPFSSKHPTHQEQSSFRKTRLHRKLALRGENGLLKPHRLKK